MSEKSVNQNKRSHTYTDRKRIINKTESYFISLVYWALKILAPLLMPANQSLYNFRKFVFGKKQLDNAPSIVQKI